MIDWFLLFLMLNLCHMIHSHVNDAYGITPWLDNGICICNLINAIVHTFFSLHLSVSFVPNITFVNNDSSQESKIYDNKIVVWLNTMMHTAFKYKTLTKSIFSNYSLPCVKCLRNLCWYILSALSYFEENRYINIYYYYYLNKYLRATVISIFLTLCYYDRLIA